MNSPVSYVDSLCPMVSQELELSVHARIIKMTEQYYPILNDDDWDPDDEPILI